MNAKAGKVASLLLLPVLLFGRFSWARKQDERARILAMKAAPMQKKFTGRKLEFDMPLSKGGVRRMYYPEAIAVPRAMVPASSWGRWDPPLPLENGRYIDLMPNEPWRPIEFEQFGEWAPGAIVVRAAEKGHLPHHSLVDVFRSKPSDETFDATRPTPKEFEDAVAHGRIQPANWRNVIPNFDIKKDQALNELEWKADIRPIDDLRFLVRDRWNGNGYAGQQVIVDKRSMGPGAVEYRYYFKVPGF